jgi:hypothetical protein
MCPRPKWITSADKRMCRASCKKTYKSVTRQQRMGEQSRLSTWPDVTVLICKCLFLLLMMIFLRSMFCIFSAVCQVDHSWILKPFLRQERIKIRVQLVSICYEDSLPYIGLTDHNIIGFWFLSRSVFDTCLSVTYNIFLKWDFSNLLCLWFICELPTIGNLKAKLNSLFQ